MCGVSSKSSQWHGANCCNWTPRPSLKTCGCHPAPGNRLEALAGDRKGQHSIRVNDQWRICFVWKAGGPHNVEIVDYH